MQEIRITTKDEKIIKINILYTLQSKVLKSLLGWDELSEDECLENDTSDIQLPLDITEKTMNNIITYFDKHFSSKDDNHQDDLNEWDKNYIDNFKDDDLFDLIKGANYLDIKDLLDLSCKKVADEIKKCNTPQEIRRRFNIKNDFTPEEEDEILKDNLWSE